MRTIHLVCNPHLDPAWQWEWEEGAAEAVSTFRVAADFCDEFDEFVFCHNEVILYKWIKEYQARTLKRIRKLVKKGRWHIMGAWYVQPDCNMPSGESLVRQALIGKAYFKEKFGAQPSTAINFDSFGHTRGLVQILKKSGYDSYVFIRPFSGDCPLPANDFTWVGYDGSEVAACRIGHYASIRGRASEKPQDWMARNPDKPVGLIPWGVGNHGGGPSRLDLQKLEALMRETKDTRIIHSTPEAYFAQLKKTGRPLPKHKKDLNPWGVGCYTSQIRIKQKHRLLENEIFMVEKMMSHAAMQGYLSYPQEELREALCDLLMAGFHDILPGSSTQPVEEASVRLMDHALEITSRLKARAFFALASGQKKAEEGQIPVFVYNPHPHKVKGVFECEFGLPDANWEEVFSVPVISADGKRVPSQVEKEHSNLSIDWRKRAVFFAELQPGRMNRFDCKIELLPKRPEPQLEKRNGKFTFKTAELEVVVNARTGLVDRYRANGVDYLRKKAFLPLVIEDNDDPWGMTVHSFRNVAGSFELMSKEDGTRFSGVTEKLLDSVRVVEDGDVRTVIEAVFSRGDSFIHQMYKLPKQGTEIEVEVRVFWNEKSKMLKLSIPTLFTDGSYLGQVAYGTTELPSDGDEAVAQKWVAAASAKGDYAFSCINDGLYGSDFCKGEIRLSLLRSPSYAGHPIYDRPIVRQDRYAPRIDQGERLFRFWLNGSPMKDRIAKLGREALIHNEKPFALSFFPSGSGTEPLPLATLSDRTVQMTAFKKAEKSGDYIIRLFEPTGRKRRAVLSVPALGVKHKVTLTKFEIKTLKLNTRTKTLTETDLLER